VRLFKFFPPYEFGTPSAPRILFDVGRFLPEVVGQERNGIDQYCGSQLAPEHEW
jgi:hypothetical protein